MKNWYATGKGRKAPKVFRDGYTYKNYGIDIIPDTQCHIRIWDKGYWCEWEPYNNYHNPNWVYPTHYNVVK